MYCKEIKLWPKKVWSKHPSDLLKSVWPGHTTEAIKRTCRIKHAVSCNSRRPSYPISDSECLNYIFLYQLLKHEKIVTSFKKVTNHNISNECNESLGSMSWNFLSHFSHAVLPFYSIDTVKFELKHKIFFLKFALYNPGMPYGLKIWYHENQRTKFYRFTYIIRCILSPICINSEQRMEKCERNFKKIQKCHVKNKTKASQNKNKSYYCNRYQ